jgi:hypothetical protein
MITFETQIPQNAKRSYIGRFSEFYWILETKIDIPRRKDILVNTVIEVI